MSRQDAVKGAEEPQAHSNGSAAPAAASAAGGAAALAEALPLRNHTHNTRSKKEAATQDQMAQQQQAEQQEQQGAGAEREAKGHETTVLQANHQGPVAAEQAAEEQASQPGHRRQRPRKPALKGSKTAPGAATCAARDAPQQQQQQQQQQLQQVQLRQAVAPAPPHGHNTRLQEREAARRVSFAAGPWAEKFGTQDGHPDHEGQLARQRRNAGARWGADLTPSAVRAVEAELGEECRPSIDRLKRRVGLLPLRKRSREHYILINGGSLQGASAQPAAASSVEPGAVPGGSPTGAACSDATQQPAKKARGTQRGVAAATSASEPPTNEEEEEQQQQQPVAAGSPAGGHARANGRAAKGGAGAGAGTAGKPGVGLDGAAAYAAVGTARPGSPAGSIAAPQASALLGRKLGASPADALAAAANGTAAVANSVNGGPPAKRASQRLGGLTGPVGLLGGFSRRSNAPGS
ncbi:hypothetical protein ABPG77_002503 [Micractinium sp. CCAP 211/92]